MMQMRLHPHMWLQEHEYKCRGVWVGLGMKLCVCVCVCGMWWCFDWVCLFMCAPLVRGVLGPAWGRKN